MIEARQGLAPVYDGVWAVARELLQEGHANVGAGGHRVDNHIIVDQRLELIHAALAHSRADGLRVQLEARGLEVATVESARLHARKELPAGEPGGLPVGSAQRRQHPVGRRGAAQGFPRDGGANRGVAHRVQVGPPDPHRHALAARVLRHELLDLVGAVLGVKGYGVHPA